MIITLRNISSMPNRGGGVEWLVLIYSAAKMQVEEGAQSSFKLQQFLCSRGYAMDNLDEAQRIHPS